MVKRIISGEIKAVALCKRGKNGLAAVYKSDNQGRQVFEFTVATKATLGDQGELYGIVAAPGIVDADGDVMDAATVKSLMYTHSANGLKLDIEHDGKILDPSLAFVAEQTIVQAGDPRFANILFAPTGAPIDPTGSWGTVVKLNSAELQAAYKRGDWNGLSLFGYVKRASDSVSTFTTAASPAQTPPPSPPTPGPTPMDEAKLASLITTALAPVNQALLALLPPTPDQVTAAQAVLARAGIKQASSAPAAPVVDPNAPPVPPLNPLDVRQVAEYQRALAAHEARKSVNWSDPVEVATFMLTLQRANLPQGQAQDPVAGASKFASLAALGGGARLTAMGAPGSEEAQYDAAADSMLAMLEAGSGNGLQQAPANGQQARKSRFGAGVFELR